MTREPNIPNDLRPLGLARGYLISADGRVFNERKRREVKPITLHMAMRFASADIAFDPVRRGGESDELVCVDVVAVRFRPGSPERVPEVARVARWVIIERPPDICFDIGPDGNHAMRRTHPDGRIEWLDDSFVLPGRMSGGSDPAHGDTDRGWFYLATDATDPQCRTSVLMHGPSVAHKLFTAD